MKFRPSSPWSLTPVSQIPGLWLLAGFLLGALLVGQLYLKESNRTELLTAELEQAQLAVELLQEGHQREAVILLMLRARTALDDAALSLDANNFGLASDNLLLATGHLQSIDPETEVVDISSIRALEGRIRTVQVRVADTNGASQRQLKALRSELSGLTLSSLDQLQKNNFPEKRTQDVSRQLRAVSTS